MKVYNVILQSQYGSEENVTVVPCLSLEAARKVLNKEAETVLNEALPYSKFNESERDEYLTIERGDDFFYVEENDFYWERYWVEAKDAVENDDTPNELYYGD